MERSPQKEPIFLKPIQEVTVGIPIRFGIGFHDGNVIDSMEVHAAVSTEINLIKEKYGKRFC